MISHPRLVNGEWVISLHDEDDNNFDYITVSRPMDTTYVLFTDGDQYTPLLAKDIPDIIQALKDLIPYAEALEKEE